jgi:putative transcriptional regulator
MDKSILEVVHESVKDLQDIGLVDTVTMKHFGVLCNHMKPVKELSPEEIKKIRKHEKLSQPIFAHLLNVSSSTVKHWETGDKVPGGAALKLLNIVRRYGIQVAFC